MPRPDVSAERKAQILQAAMQVAARKGYATTRMDDVAREAGLSVGILYWYFKGKLDIALTLMDLFFAPDLETLAKTLSTPGTCHDKLWTLFIQDFEQDANSLLLFLWAELYSLAAREPKVRKKLLSYLAEYRRLTTRLLTQGIQSGELRADLDPEVAANTLIVLFDGFMVNLAISPAADFREKFRQSFDLLWMGLTR